MHKNMLVFVLFAALCALVGEKSRIMKMVLLVQCVQYYLEKKSIICTHSTLQNNIQCDKLYLTSQHTWHRTIATQHKTNDNIKERK